MALRKPSALKRQRQEEKRRLRNKSIKSKVKTFVKTAKSSVLEQNEKTSDHVKQAVKELDKAASKGVIHKNTASRKKSRLAKHVNKYSTKT